MTMCVEATNHTVGHACACIYVRNSEHVLACVCMYIPQAKACVAGAGAHMSFHSVGHVCVRISVRICDNLRKLFDYWRVDVGNSS